MPWIFKLVVERGEVNIKTIGDLMEFGKKARAEKNFLIYKRGMILQIYDNRDLQILVRDRRFNGVLKFTDVGRGRCQVEAQIAGEIYNDTGIDYSKRIYLPLDARLTKVTQNFSLKKCVQAIVSELITSDVVKEIVLEMAFIRENVVKFIWKTFSLLENEEGQAFCYLTKSKSGINKLGRKFIFNDIDRHRYLLEEDTIDDIISEMIEEFIKNEKISDDIREGWEENKEIFLTIFSYYIHKYRQLNQELREMIEPEFQTLDEFSEDQVSVHKHRTMAIQSLPGTQINKTNKKMKYARKDMACYLRLRFEELGIEQKWLIEDIANVISMTPRGVKQFLVDRCEIHECFIDKTAKDYIGIRTLVEILLKNDKISEITREYLEENKDKLISEFDRFIRRYQQLKKKHDKQVKEKDRFQKTKMVRKDAEDFLWIGKISLEIRKNNPLQIVLRNEYYYPLYRFTVIENNRWEIEDIRDYTKWNDDPIDKLEIPFGTPFAEACKIFVEYVRKITKQFHDSELEGTY